MKKLAIEAVMAFLRYQEADGIFPDPEYDQFMDAMGRLADGLGMDCEKIGLKIRADMVSAGKATSR